MKTLYLECNMGAAGDMLMAALLELHPNAADFVRRFQALGIPGVTLEIAPSQKCGITGSRAIIKVDGVSEELLHKHEEGIPERHLHQHREGISESPPHEHEEGIPERHHHHTGMHDIEELVHHFPVSEKVREDVLSVYRLIAEAESVAHSCAVEQVHFHEVGTMDAIADVTGVCMLIEELAPERIVASPVHVGCGQVECAHGILPVPAPATAYLLRGAPTYGGRVRGELCTPTGAALLKYFVDEFGDQPVMRVEKIGYGMGHRDFPAANCIRAMMGECEQVMDQIIELACNLDDMTPEAVGYATELLLQEGALDVFTSAIQMKKSRPGILLTCLCQKTDREKFIRLILKYTTTLGIREYQCDRYGLSREEKTVQTEYGSVRKKVSTGFGVQREKFEYEDIAQIARNTKKPIPEIIEALLQGH